MRKLLIAAAALLLPVLPATSSEVVEIGPFQIHDSFWMSLHQTLIADAGGFADLDRSVLSQQESGVWDDAVRSYRDAAPGRSMYFERPMMITSDLLTQVADDASILGVDPPMAEVLLTAAPIYRKHWWASHTKANAFFIARVSGMLDESAEELIAAHEAVYGESWPDRIRVYVTPYGGSLGAYSMGGKEGGWIVTVSSLDRGHYGLGALEVIFHEASHSIVHPRHGTVAAALKMAAGEGREPPRDLWHAILFATTSELVRRYLEERGIEYTPFAEDLLTRAWPQYRVPIETHWYPYLDGQGTLESAIANVVGAIEK